MLVIFLGVILFRITPRNIQVCIPKQGLELGILRTAKVLACCLLVLPLIGTACKSVSNVRAKTLDATAQQALRASVQVELRHGADLFRSGHYQEAQLRFESLLKVTAQARLDDLTLRVQSNIGGCLFALHQYRPALRSFLEARHLAVTSGDPGAISVLDANIASLYSAMGELETGAEWMKGVLRAPIESLLPQEVPKLLIQMAVLRAGQERMPEAAGLFREGIDAADRLGDLETCALGWNRLGEELLKQHKLIEAEPALLEAYHIRKLHHLALDTSYRNLGRLRLEQGDLVSASALLNRAVDLAERPGGVLPAWHVYYYRGSVRLAQGRLRQALEDLHVAVRLARAWRGSAFQDDAGRVGAEQWLELVHSALIEAGNRLYLQTRDPALIRETFEAAEENRASSLRALLGDKRAPDRPPAYWEALARLQRAEVNALRTKDERAEDEVRATRAELIRLEAAVLPGSDSLPTALLEGARAALGADDALLSFHLGDSISWLWALDGAGLQVYPLPARQVIETQAQAAYDAIRGDTPAALAAGAALYRDLFGVLAPRFRRKTQWLVALDPGLFEVPLAALPEEVHPRPVYLVERRTIKVIPGAGVWLESAARRNGPPQSDLFLGVGDPVYNTADPRQQNRGRQASGPSASPFRLLAAGLERESPADRGLPMPRLVASGVELESCARAWGGERVLLTGPAASRQGVVEQLRRGPAVVHFATHVLASSGKPSYGLIALSLNSRGESEVLPPLEIAHWRVRTELVVLSGCHSAAGAALPGTGLMGLTRAWIASGAGAVVGSRWSTPDEEGALFTAFYRRLKLQARRDPALALRAAQLEMLQSAGWRSRPHYWGAYFAVGIQ